MSATTLSRACDLRVGDRFEHRSALLGQHRIGTFVCEVLAEAELSRDAAGAPTVIVPCRTVDPATGAVHEGTVSFPVYEWVNVETA